MINITSIGFPLTSDGVLNINFDDGQTLLDSDIVIINPESLNPFWKNSTEERYLYSHYGADQIRSIFTLRREEISTLLNKGKIIIIFLAPVQGVHAEIKKSSKYDIISNYTFLPNSFEYVISNIVSGHGTSIKLCNPKHLFANYYKAFLNELQYFAYLNLGTMKADDCLLLNKSDRPVGFSFIESNGLIVFLPYPPTKYDTEKLVGVLINCSKPFLTKEIKTPSPEWVNNFEILGESKLLSEINSLNVEIHKLETQKSEVQKGLNELIEFKALLYEQGKLLEKSAIKAFRVLGFQAERRQKNDMEHDIILTCSEGRAVVEIEGKDNDSIHIDKLDQLSRVVDEDFTLSGSYPDGILLGNHFRFVDPLKRKEAFTEKVKIASGRKNLILLTTFELYKAANKVLKNPTDESLKKELRIKIFEGKGKEIRLIEE